LNEIPNRSKFVTGLAWVFIVTTGFTTFMSLLQGVVLFAIFPMGQMNDLLGQVDAAEIPGVLHFLFSHIGFVFFLSLLMSATTFAGSVGLLKRQNWARIFFIWMLGLGIFWTVVSVPAIFFIPSGMSPEVDEVFGGSFRMMMTLVKVLCFLLALAHCALFGWIIWKLMTPTIKAEFRVA